MIESMLASHKQKSRMRGKDPKAHADTSETTKTNNWKLYIGVPTKSIKSNER